MLHQIDRKRLALLQMKAKQLTERSQKDPRIEAQINDITEKVRAYETSKQPPTDKELRSVAQDEMKRAGIVQLGIKRPGADTVQPISAS
jgi:hypothetical protein